MVVDSSALLAIIFGEPDAGKYASAISTCFEADEVVRIPASVLVEASIVAESRKGGNAERLAMLIDRIQPEIVPLSAPIAQLSISAFRKFGKGVHRASLNFGDCMSYATADYLIDTLLYKGDDFALTPIRAALSSPQR